MNKHTNIYTLHVSFRDGLCVSILTIIDHHQLQTYLGEK